MIVDLFKRRTRLELRRRRAMAAITRIEQMIVDCPNPLSVAKLLDWKKSLATVDGALRRLDKAERPRLKEILGN